MRPSARFRFSVVIVFLLAAALAGCRDRAPEREAPAVVLTVAAAASLREALTELEGRYEAANVGVEVRTTFGGSGLLRQQVEQGAPVDVFISAAETPMDALQAAGLVDPRTRRVLAGNELVVVVPRASPVAIDGFDDLGAPEVRRVALGAPQSVPAGEYAGEVLRALGIAEAVGKKAVYGQNVRQVLAYVESGDVEAGVVYRTDAAVAKEVRVAAAAPPGSHAPITYPVAVVSRTRVPEAARGYVAFLLGPEGRETLRRRGFRAE